MSSLELVGLLLLLGLMIFGGVPIGYALAIVGSLGITLMIGLEPATGLLVNSTYQTVSNYLFMAIPMFILMAEYMKQAELTDEIFTAAYRFLSHIPGGLAMATTIANGFFAALSGSSVAAAASMSTIAVPEMRKYGYDDRLSLGTVAAAGTFAVMIPPSLALIIYGIITENSIGALFAAGIIPGIMTLFSYIIVIYTWGRVRPEVIGGGDLPRHSWSERVASLRPIFPMGVVVVLVLGGFYLGITTPAEAGAVGASGVFVIAVIMGLLSVDGIKTATMDAVKTSTLIFVLLIGASMFSRYLTLTGAPQMLINTVSGLPLSNIIVFVLLIGVYVLLGMIMSQAAILILTLPITYPVVTGLGFGPIWFGIIIVKTIEIGMVSPPFGLNVFVASSPLEVDVDIGFRGALRFILADAVVLLALLAFPDVVLVVPDMLGY